jgi:hypothetical protein
MAGDSWVSQENLGSIGGRGIVFTIASKPTVESLRPLFISYFGISTGDKEARA